jgi:hypothetical protein
VLGKRNEARRKAESEELFKQMLKAKHTVEEPKKTKGTRKTKESKAIKDQLEGGASPSNEAL